MTGLYFTRLGEVSLPAAASRTIARLTGAEAGYVTTGAAAALTLSAAAAIAGLDPARMARLPDTRGLANRLLIVRAHRNADDHAAATAFGSAGGVARQDVAHELPGMDSQRPPAGPKSVAAG